MPKFLYHLVPKKLFNKFVDGCGNYDRRNNKKWGKNSRFIHTSPTKKQLKERVADINWRNYPLGEQFILLEINPKKVVGKITNVLVNGYTYHHVWSPLSKEFFKILKVRRDRGGKFIIS